jgi:hypothetical protein
LGVSIAWYNKKEFVCSFNFDDELPYIEFFYVKDINCKIRQPLYNLKYVNSYYFMSS